VRVGRDACLSVLCVCAREMLNTYARAPPARRHAHRRARLSTRTGTRARDARAQMHLRGSRHASTPLRVSRHTTTQASGHTNMQACRGLVRRCPRGSGWRSISVDGAGLGQSQSGRPGSGSCLLGASFSGAPSSRRLRADSLPRVTRHGNPQRCSIRRWWGKLRGAGLERGVSRRGAGQL
jgi:hypothetical protein